MGLLKALVIGFLAAIGIATIAHEAAGDFGEVVRWHNLHLLAGGFHIYFSLPVLAVVTVFSWGLIYWSRR